MYILKNALRCITRAKGRNILIGLIVLLVSASSCIGLSIKQANKTLKQQYANNMEITGSITSKDIKGTESIPLSTLEKYASSDAVKNFYYTSDLYFAAGDGIEPVDVAGSFKQNKDFKEKYGDVKNGDKKTTSSTGSTTVTTSEYTESSGSTDSSSSSDEGTVNSAYTTLSAKLSVSSVGEETKNNESSGKSDDDGKNDDGKTSSDNAGKKEDENNSSDKANVKEGENTDKNKISSEKEKTSSGTQSEKSSTTDKSSKSDDQKTPPQAPDDGETRRINRTTIIKGGDTVVNNQFFFNMASMNDFTVSGYTSTSSLPDYVSTLNVLDLNSDDLNCVISKNLADENNLKVGSTFKLNNPNNSDETYKFTVVGIADTSSNTDTGDTSSNASFSDNVIYVSAAAVEKITTASAKTNKSDSAESALSSSDSSESEQKSNALTPTYSGTYTFKNLNDYNSFESSLDDGYTLVSSDVQNYETGVSQLETLGGYATYFLLVIFAIGGFVLIVINVFSIRDRKYEIGVLTAMGMKKGKVALQFLSEVFIVTFAALIIGSAAGAATSVTVTNKLLTAVNSTSVSASAQQDGNKSESTASPAAESPQKDDKDMAPDMNGAMGGMAKNSYVASVTSATNMTVVVQMIGVGLLLTVISGLAAVTFIMRYEPLKILSNRD